MLPTRTRANARRRYEPKHEVTLDFHDVHGRVVDRRTVYRPLPKQDRLHACTTPNILFGGAAGGSKSHGIRWHFIIACLLHPGFNALIVRRHYTDLESNFLRKYAMEVPPEMAELVGHELRFPNTSRIVHGHLQYERDVGKYQGGDWNGIGVDEAGQLTPWQLAMLRGWLRTTSPHILPQYVLASNPGGPGHLWLKRRFISKSGVPTDEEPDYDPADYTFIPSRVEDNPYLDPGYIARLRSLPRKERQAFLEGNWEVFAGQYFDEWRRELHVIAPPERKPIEIPGWWDLEGGFDWGYDPHPAVLELAGFDQHQRALFYREIVFERTAPTALADRIVERCTLPKEQDLIVRASPDLWVKNPETGEPIAETINNRLADLDSGITFVKANPDRLNGWARVHDWLDPKRAHPDGGKAPYMRVLDYDDRSGLGCPELVEAIPALVHDDKPTKVWDVLKAAGDDPPDAARYLLMGRPPLPRLPAELRPGRPHHRRVHDKTRKVLARVRRQQRLEEAEE